MKKIIMDLSMDIYHDIRVDKDTVLDRKNENAEQTPEDLGVTVCTK